MLAIGRGLVADRRLLMLDEPSLGLSPLFVQSIFRTLAAFQKRGLTVLVVEQIESDVDLCDAVRRFRTRPHRCRRAGD